VSGARFRLGLVVGKFSPLHRGHLWLVEQAASRCERVLVLSYSEPELPGCDAQSRRRWLEAAFPAHEVVVVDPAWLAAACAARGVPARTLPANASDDATQQHFLAWLLAQVLQRRPDAMFASEPYLVPCAAVLGRTLGHTVTPVMGDPARTGLPIRASHIRERPSALLHWLPPHVRADLVPRIALLGGESSGKTTLAAALAAQLGTRWVCEYGRELWERKGGALEEQDLLHIAREQVRREAEAAATAAPVLVCDTSPLTTLGYSLWSHGRADPRLQALAERPYALNVLCGDDIAFVQDGTRQGEAFRARQQAWYRAQLPARAGRWVEVRGSVAERTAQVLAALGPVAAATAP
jgi:HTH-type transcriptional regulator, transcriptional repressor of NAD biosynthesis genes